MLSGLHHKLFFIYSAFVRLQILAVFFVITQHYFAAAMIFYGFFGE